MAELLNKLKQDYVSSTQSTDWLINQLKDPDDKFIKVVSASDIRPGKIYFIFYDLAGALKSSKMEQYSPILALKTAKSGNYPILWGFNLNFVPERVRVNWFDQLIDKFFKGLLTDPKKIEKTENLNVSFEGVYSTLAWIGYEYSIREYRLDLIDRVYQVDLSKIDKFASLQTERFSGVDAKKLIEIWLSKLGESEQRLKDLKMNSISNISILDDELNRSFEQLLSSQKYLNNI